MDSSEENKNPDEEAVIIDPITLKPELYSAAVANDTTKVISLLQQQVPGTFIDAASGWTPLHWAAVHGNVIMTKALLKSGASEPYHRLIARAIKQIQLANLADSRINMILLPNHGLDEEDGDLDLGYELKVEEAPKEEAEDVDDPNKASEVSVDLLKNTPLLWAAREGHLGVIWPLLQDGYSPNDTDKLDNNALHLAAANGDLKILKVLIDDGGNANVVNHYKNLPIDLAKSKEAHHMLASAMAAGASMTEKDVLEKHERNMRHYATIVNNLIEAVREASVVNDPIRIKDITSADSVSMTTKLSSVIQVGKEWALDRDSISDAGQLLVKLELLQELANEIKNVKRLIPIRTQRAYIEHVNKLESSIERSHAAGIAKSQLDAGLDLIRRCQCEHWISLLLDRLKGVVTADDSNEHDMNKLRSAISKADPADTDKSLLEEATKFQNRLYAELGMSRSIRSIPRYVLPPADGVVVPEGYWSEDDLGKIEEHEGYPFPPAETGEYKWLPSKAFLSLERAISQIKRSYNGADELGANPSIIAEAKDKLLKAEKDFKVLDAKNEADKAKAIETAKKMAKKLKAGKKGAKK